MSQPILSWRTPSNFIEDRLTSPIFGSTPDDAHAHWGRLPTLEQAVLESRQNILSTELWSHVGTDALDEPLAFGADSGGGVLSMPQTIFNITNIVVGVGVLSVPYALKMTGYSALLLLILVIYVTGTTAKWTGECVQLASRSPLADRVPPGARDFGFLALVALGPRHQVLVNTVTVLEIWLALVTYMVMNGANAGIIWPEFSAEAMIPLLGTMACLLVFVPPHVSAYLSLISTSAMFLAAAAMVGATTLLQHWSEPYEKLGQAALIQPSNIPRSVGILVFCFAGHPCFPGVMSSMKAPTKWGCSVLIGFVLACIFYGAIGILGYVVFGDDTEPAMTKNLTHIQGAGFWRMAAAFCFLVKVQLTAPMLLNAIIIALWAPSALSRQWPVGRIILVLVVGAVTVGVALGLANRVAVVASLAGSLLVMMTSVLFPAVLHIKLSCLDKNQPIGFWNAMNYTFVIIFGIVMATTGTTLAVKDLLR
mmetsp:Transcript_15137/g.32644  ORF Transcript_15137/g.32644 Transcript_15137/m.32644 type:complete len:479 (-) Transcript_15137:132-1568(-)|eukprot:CAMPEP_0206435922 /NCGR_PEP_ID=MMETSP0324_2-20121206/10181_1 /ASSEMBLY_ACC=CAM_ASM_000836 /TAXON_ID=2866 /ORGANISM="Crypthecodinium cohnii, Strain Seligo" /LENGTH=478 /DNA_ID=CAMNT_0053902999 /DNA_START=52 /DNA_END=1488 /DNA_ORIENTATION=-